jgi:CRISPR/Cas system-associated exonuclease Cas4 (RecB family)
MAFMPLDIERMVHGKIGGMEFAGTPDRVGMLGLLRTVVDLKSGAISRATALQTAAYAELTNCQHRVAVRLTPGAKYSVKVFPASELRRDLAQFRAALSNWWWARRKA